MEPMIGEEDVADRLGSWLRVGLDARYVARAAISAHLAALERAGWVVVPREPTEAMIDAGDDICPIARGTESHKIAGGVVPEDYWRAMLAAAPPPQNSDEVKG